MTNKNTSEWRVSANPMGDGIYYGVYRIVDIDEIDHSGNRETYGGLYSVRATAEALADRLNKEGADAGN